MDNESTIPPAPAQQSASAGYPSFWRRLGALIIDGIILAIGGAVLGALLISTLGAGLGILCMALASSAYYVVMHGQFGATVGKMALGMQVKKLDGSPIDMTIAAIRYSPFFIFAVLAALTAPATSGVPAAEVAAAAPSAMAGFVGMAQFLFIIASWIVLLTNKQNRTIHDFLGNTVVVHKTPEDAVVV